MTCIGNSGLLTEPIVEAIEKVSTLMSASLGGVCVSVCVMCVCVCVRAETKVEI